VAATAAGLDATALLKRAKSPEIEARARRARRNFTRSKSLSGQRSCWRNAIGDRAVFSGLVVAAPLAAAIEAMLHDAAAYASFAAHFGGRQSRTGLQSKVPNPIGDLRDLSLAWSWRVATPQSTRPAPPQLCGEKSKKEACIILNKGHYWSQ